VVRLGYITSPASNAVFPTATIASRSGGQISEETALIAGVDFWKQDAAEKRAADLDA
jgi:hypothetical protein